MKKIISMVLSFILILGCSTTAFAAETHNYDTENLPHDGADYFETEIKADEENEERISDFVTVYGYQYTKGSLKSGAWRNGTSGGSSTSSAKLSLNYTQDTSYNISFKASVDCQHFFRQIFLGYFSDIVQAFDTLRKNVCGDDYTSLHNPIVLSSVLPAYGMFHSIQILFL